MLLVGAVNATANVTLTLTSPVVNLKEGVFPTLDFTLSNNSADPIQFWSGGLFLGASTTFVSGDPTDGLTLDAFAFNVSSCLGQIAPGGSCTLVGGYLFVPDNTPEDTDFGIYSYDVQVRYVTCDPNTGGCSTTPMQVDTQFNLTIYDQGASVPEPSALLLLGAGSGLLGIGRHRLRRVWKID